MKMILVLTDFSQAAKRAADVALYFSEQFKMGILLLHSYHLPQISLGKLDNQDYVKLQGISEVNLEKERNRLLKRVKENNSKSLIRVHAINTISPLSEILFDIQQGYEIKLVIVGSHKKLSKSFLEASHVLIVLRNSDSPLLIVPVKGLTINEIKMKLASDLDRKDLKLILQLKKLSRFLSIPLSVIHFMAKESFVADFNEEDNIQNFTKALAQPAFEEIGFHLIDGASMIKETIKKVNKNGLLIVVNRSHHLLYELLNRSNCKEFIKIHKGPLLILPEKWEMRGHLRKVDIFSKKNKMRITK